jgi:hypothetical protein
MAQLEPVHVLEPDRATTKMECVRINPTRSFADLGPSGMALYTWQNGVWFDQGGMQIATENVPEEHRRVMAEVPIVITTGGPAIVWTCEFCNERMNSSEKEQHLIGHIRGTFASTGTPQTPAAETPQPPAPVRERQRIPAAS